MTLISKFKEKCSMGSMREESLRKQWLMSDKKCIENSMVINFMIFFLNRPVICRYTESNTAATPLNNAQPWRLFLSLNSERPHG